MPLAKSIHRASLFVTPLLKTLMMSRMERRKRLGKNGPMRGARLRAGAVKWLDRIDDRSVAITFIRLHAAVQAMAEDESFDVRIKDITDERLAEEAKELSVAYSEAFDVLGSGFVGNAARYQDYRNLQKLYQAVKLSLADQIILNEELHDNLESADRRAEDALAELAELKASGASDVSPGVDHPAASSQGQGNPVATEESDPFAL